MALIIRGLKIRGADLNAVEDVLNEIKEKVNLKARRLYAELLAKEIELFVDDIALNILERPAGRSIYDTCVNELNNKISWATENNSGTAYNFGVKAAIYLYKGDTYISLRIGNIKIANELKLNINGVDNFDLKNTDNAAPDAHASVWNEIMSIYEGDTTPLFRQIYPIGKIEVEWKKISQYFHRPSERAKLRARYAITHELINQIGMNKQIPNFRMLPYIDEALEMLTLPQIQEDANSRILRATGVFVNITEEMVKADPNSEAPKTFEDLKN